MSDKERAYGDSAANTDTRREVGQHSANDVVNSPIPTHSHTCRAVSTTPPVLSRPLSCTATPALATQPPPTASKLSTCSPQRTFFAINELVREVVGYLSSSREDMIKCLYVSKSFNLAAVPHVYKEIPLKHLSTVDSVLKANYLRTVIVPQPEECTDAALQLTSRYHVFFQAAENYHYRTGWSTCVNRQGNVVYHFTYNEHPRTRELAHDFPSISNTLKGTEPLVHSSSASSITIAFVPPYISGEVFPASFDLGQCGAVAFESQPQAVINLVGVDLHDPFSESENWKSAFDLKPAFVDAVDEHYNSWERTPTPPKETKDQLLSRVQYTTFKEYLETTSEWKNVLDWRRVGEWLNKYEERELAERSSVIQESENTAGATAKR